MMLQTEMGSLELPIPSKEKEKRSSNAQAQQPLPCPRCDSISTKFCYFNNYNLAQPCHYCRSSKRYWTHGGTLRNVPVEGSSRRSYSSSSSAERRTAAAARGAATPPPRKPQMEINNIVGNGMNVTSSGFVLGSGPFGFEIVPGFDAMQGLGFDTTRAFWAYSEIANNDVMTTAATVSGGEGGGATAVDSSGVDWWRLEDAIVQGGNGEEEGFLACPDLSISLPTKGLN